MCFEGAFILSDTPRLNIDGVWVAFLDANRIYLHFYLSNGQVDSQLLNFYHGSFILQCSSLLDQALRIYKTLANIPVCTVSNPVFTSPNKGAGLITWSRKLFS